MGKIDKIKESLSTLRALIAIFVALIAAITGSLVNLYRLHEVDDLFWIGIVFDVLMFVVLAFIFIRIHRLTDEIGEL
jgi:hypothetical protein